MYLASAPTAIALSSYTSMYNNATLTIYSGTAPATAETALSGNTELAIFTFAATAFSTVSTSGGYDLQTASFVSATVTPDNTGVATFARANFVPKTWAATTAFTRGDIASHNSNYYLCIVSGTSGSTGPSGTGMGQLDSGAAWDYIGPTTGGTIIAQFTVGTTNSDILLATTNVQAGVTATITQFEFLIPVN